MRKKLMLVAMVFVLMMSVGATAYASPSNSKANRDYKGLVDIGKFSLYADIQGSANRSKGEPAIVFESGRDVSHAIWAGAQSGLSSKTQTISYDRANIGLSENSGTTYDAVTQAKQLHKLLKKSKVKAPYILVTHSYGSAITTVFADMYSSEVAGVVFVDAAHVDQEAVTTDTFPVERQAIFKSMFKLEGGYPTIVQTLQQAKDTYSDKPFKDVPLTVLSGTEHGLGPVIEATWANLQLDLLTLSDYSKQIIVQGGDHYFMLTHPQVVVDAVIDIMK
ncbi:alpha/beta hydrolase [Paenibacillus sp. GSMTC-2017]|uniref:alpha/beta fold hydrolase n=1 Tax=Paenibacillus sp. GSMTC-2017 TaxID=2794350 RepID=UPI0018D86350|nr:alpha/beta hydrolase [Paenibacillus sp. GSMTC-2017]MBH5316304.1 alpha/beta hydrolase [Paenibacillus sp. GSMTC-2017]